MAPTVSGTTWRASHIAVVAWVTEENSAKILLRATRTAYVKTKESVPWGAMVPTAAAEGDIMGCFVNRRLSVCPRGSAKTTEHAQ